MKQVADKHRSDRQFKTEDFAYVKLHPYRQVSMAFTGNSKLSPKYFGPFRVVDCIGTVAYRLDIPAHSKVHNVFHVSQLKKHVGNLVTTTDQREDVFAKKEPKAIPDGMTIRRRGMPVTKVLVKWKHTISQRMQLENTTMT